MRLLALVLNNKDSAAHDPGETAGTGEQGLRDSFDIFGDMIGKKKENILRMG
jgi:hypothetical protein